MSAKASEASKSRHTEPQTVACIVQSRAREVCICVMRENSNQLDIQIVIDGHSYNESMLALQEIAPDQILLQDNSKSSGLAQKIEEIFRKEACVAFLNRQYFDQDRGAELLRKVAFGHLDSDILAKYTVLAASYCLIRYMEGTSGATFADKTIRISSLSLGSKRMLIDRRTAINLELVSTMRSGKQDQSLFGVVNRTRTSVGARLLRSEILRPLAEISSIQPRSLSVDLLARLGESERTRLVSTLASLPDMDSMLSGLSTEPKTLSAATARRGIETLLNVQLCLQAAAKLSQQLGSIQTLRSSELLEAVIQSLSGEELEAMLLRINVLVPPSRGTSGKSSHELRHEECFALCSGVDGLLDLARTAYMQTVEDLHKLTDQYIQTFGLDARLQYSAGRGFYLSLPNTEFLPNTFIQAVMHKRTIACTTMELQSLSDRATECINQALISTNQLIQGLVQDIREGLKSLYSLVDNVALLDMLLSFADLLCTAPRPMCLPLLSTEGSLVIHAGRHPLLSLHGSLRQPQPFVPNDTLLSTAGNMCIVTGPNGSGKSVYVKQIALIAVMAQIGCCVPAKQARIPICDRILSRLGTIDSMESNLSTFAMEMKDAAYISSHVSKTSLVIIDELGKGTSNTDGIALALALAEDLAVSQAFILFTTHYHSLSAISNFHPNVRNIHFGIEDNDVDNLQPGSFTHKLGDGPCSLGSGYGVAIADACRIPGTIVECARNKMGLLRDRRGTLVEAPHGAIALKKTIACILHRVAVIYHSQEKSGQRDLRNALVELQALLLSSPAVDLLKSSLEL